MPDIFVAPKKSAPEEKPAPENLAPQESKGHSLSAFMSYPDNVHFDTQATEERIILFLRKHWITNIPWLLMTFFLFAAPSVIFPFIVGQGLLSLLPANFIIVLSLFWYLAVFGFAFVNFISWYFNVYIVTNERIIDVDFLQLLYKQMSSARIERVQDLTYKLGGVVRALFDFGDVFIQTAGEEPNFDFEAVPHPEQVVRTLSELTEKRQEPV